MSQEKYRSLHEIAEEISHFKTSNTKLEVEISKILEEVKKIEETTKEENNKRLFQFKMDLEKKMRMEMSIKSFEIAANAAGKSSDPKLQSMSRDFFILKLSAEAEAQKRSSLESKEKEKSVHRNQGAVILDETEIRNEMEGLEKQMEEAIESCAIQRKRNKELNEEPTCLNEPNQNQVATHWMNTKEGILLQELREVSEIQRDIVETAMRNSEINQHILRKFKGLSASKKS